MIYHLTNEKNELLLEADEEDLDLFKEAVKIAICEHIDKNLNDHFFDIKVTIDYEKRD